MRFHLSLRSTLLSSIWVILWFQRCHPFQSVFRTSLIQTTRGAVTNGSSTLQESTESSSQLKQAEKVTRPLNVSPAFEATVPRRPRKVKSHAVAARAVLRNIEDGGWMLRYLEDDPMYKRLEDPRDRNFARVLVTTVERRMGQIDKVLDQVMLYPPKNDKYRSRLQAILRIGVAQLLFLRTADHAAVKESVDLLHMSEFYTPDNIVRKCNAVLRQTSVQGAELLHNSTSLDDNVAPWILELLRRQWGNTTTNAIIAQHAFPIQKVDISVRVPVGVDRKEFLDDLQLKLKDGSSKLEEIECVQLPHGNMIRTDRLGGGLKNWPGFTAGLWWVQESISALPALALSNGLRQGNKNELSRCRVVDLISAAQGEGGSKCAQLLDLGVGHVTAITSNENRRTNLFKTLHRLRFSNNKSDNDRIQAVLSNPLRYLPESPVDGILLDAPCTSTGNLDLSHVFHKQRSNLRICLGLQRELLKHCVNILPVGGILVYASNSLLKYEGEDQIEELLSSFSGCVEIMPILPGEISGFDRAINDRGCLRVLPGTLKGPLHECNGIFVARLVKVDNTTIQQLN